LTANKNETLGAFLNSISHSFFNKFSNKEFSTLLCLRYNLDLDFIPTNLPCTCRRKTKITDNLRPKIIDKKGFHPVTLATVTVTLLLFMMLFKTSLPEPLKVEVAM
jgi:hypothetical protein